MESYALAHTQPTVSHVIHHLARNLFLACRHPAFAANTPVVHIRWPVPLPRHRRHLLPLRQRSPWPLCKDIRLCPAHGRSYATHNPPVLTASSPCPRLAFSIFQLQVRISWWLSMARSHASWPWRALAAHQHPLTLSLQVHPRRVQTHYLCPRPSRPREHSIRRQFEQHPLSP